MFQKEKKICSDMDCGKCGSLLDCIQHVKISLVLTADFYCQLAHRISSHSSHS